ASKSGREAADVLRKLEQNFASIPMLTNAFDLEKAKGDYAEGLRQISFSQFRTGGNPVCVPLCAGSHCMGLAILADRVGGTDYTGAGLALLTCMWATVAGGLRNFRLTDRLT